MTRREQSSTQASQRAWQAIAALGAATLLAALLGLGLPAAGTAYAASSAEQKGQEYAQEDPGYQAAQQGSGSTQYFLDIEEPEPEKAPIDTSGTGLPKTGDSAESRLLLMSLGGLGVLAIAGLCVALWPRKREDDEPKDAWDDEAVFKDELEDDEF